MITPRSILLLLAFCLWVSTASAQQKKSLSHDDYASWNTLSDQQVSPDGQWLVYEVNPQQGDGTLYIRHFESGSEVLIPRGAGALFSPGGGYVVFSIKPPAALVRRAKAEKKKPEEMPTDSLGIFLFAHQRLEKIAGPVSFSLPAESSHWMVYHIDLPTGRNNRPTSQQPGSEDQHTPADTLKTQPTPKTRKLFVYNPLTGFRHLIENIGEYVISANGNLVAGVAEVKQGDTLQLQQLLVYKPSEQRQISIDSRQGEIRQLNIDFEGIQLAWLHSPDTGNVKVYRLWHWEHQRNRISEVVSADTQGMPPGFSPSHHRKPYFSKNGQRLFFGTGPNPKTEPKDTLLPEEKYSLDLWHWNEPVLQSVQLSNLRRERNRTFIGVYHIRQQKFVQLTNEQFPEISLDVDNNLLMALGSTNIPYQLETDWTGSNTRDLYTVNLNDGNRRLIQQGVNSRTILSPHGKFVTWFDTAQKQWMVYDLATASQRSLTGSIPVAFYNQEQDQPQEAGPYGFSGWTENDAFLLLNDRFDIWKIDPTGRRSPENLTQGFGRENQIRFRIQNLNSKVPFFRLNERLIFEAFNVANKKSGFFALQNGTLKSLIIEDALFSQLQKASGADRLVWRRSTFNDFSDLYTGTPDFKDIVKISDANPQQNEFYWGIAKLVEWLDFENKKLQGLMYLPEDFDQTKKYPMLVYFYERSSDGLHQHAIPSPSRSTINRAYCTSNGYIVFIPDITYKDGFPGESAYNAIVSGTKAMVERYAFIDRENMGLQGQSWGGYQIAYLVTRTNMFKAAMAGAPVSNMVSAYGAIRWESGRSRQFQYEQTQSRIGGTLWQKPLRYIENSPVFFADKIETPLLIMHNDNDGAVPWYQGIELFMAMRRLSKPVWMLVYNNEGHNLTQWPARMDLSVRMYQFFDHFLKDAPAPHWMIHGIPAVDKGKHHGYELAN